MRVIATATTSFLPAAVDLAVQPCGNNIPQPVNTGWPTTVAGGCGCVYLLNLLKLATHFRGDEVYFYSF
jgi:hypothetical protein